MEVIYEDKFCEVTTSRLTIFSYYFPFGSITIPIRTITKISLLKGGVYRIHGSGDFIHWWAADWGRFGSATAPAGYLMITVEDDSIVKCFTCEHVDRLVGLLTRNGSHITREDVTVRDLFLCGVGG